MSDPKYSHVSVPDFGEDGNAMFMVAKVTKALRRAGVSRDEIDAFAAEALSGDYDHVIQTILATVDVDGEATQ